MTFGFLEFIAGCVTGFVVTILLEVLVIGLACRAICRAEEEAGKLRLDSALEGASAPRGGDGPGDALGASH
jgi:hypothetical protein